MSLSIIDKMVVNFIKSQESLFTLIRELENGRTTYRRALSDDAEEVVYINPLPDGKFRLLYQRLMAIGVPTHIKGEGPYRGTVDKEGTPLDEEGKKIEKVLYRIRI